MWEALFKALFEFFEQSSEEENEIQTSEANVSVIEVQRGQRDSANTNTDGGYSFGDVNKVILWNSNNRFHTAGPPSTTGNQGVQDMSGAITLHSASQIRYHKFSGSISSRFNWETWEYTGPDGGDSEFIVRGQFELVIPSGNQVSAAVSGIVDRNRCVPIITGILGSATNNHSYCGTGISWIDSSNRVWAKGQRGAYQTTVFVTVVEFVGDAWQIGHARIPNTGGFDQGTFTLKEDSDGISGNNFSVISWDNAFIHGNLAALDTSNRAIVDHSANFLPGSTNDTAKYLHHPEHDGASDMVIHVISHPALTVYRFQDAQTTDGATTFTIPSTLGLTSLDKVSVQHTRTSSGTGGAYGRGWSNVKPLSLTSIELYCHRFGNTIDSRVSVIDLAYITGAGFYIFNISGSIDRVIISGTTATITGLGFGATQGSSVVDLWNDDSGSISQTQSIVSWSDTEIIFTVSLGSVPNEIDGYVAVTVGGNTINSSTRIGPKPLISYYSTIQNLFPDHWWTLNNNYTDQGTAVQCDMTQAVVGDGGSFETDPICDFNTYSWLADNRIRREAPDNVDMNNAATFERTMCGWIRVNQLTKDFSCIYKEGGGVNNIGFLLGVGNILIATLADTNDDNVQAFSDFKLEPGRPYHIMFRFSYNEPNPADREFRLYIDGRLQESTAGNPLLATDLDGHPGDIVFGGTDTNLEVSGTDVRFVDQESTNFAQWVSWTQALSQNDITDLFARGALPEVTLSGTAANIQSQLNALSGTTLSNSPLSIRIENPSDTDVLNLDADNVIFDEKASLYIEWRGGILNWKNLNGTNLTIDKVYNTAGGVTNILQPYVLTLTGIQNPSEVRIYESGTANEIAGQENVTTGTFSTNVEVDFVTIVIMAIDYKFFRLDNINITSNTIIPIQQTFDRNYDN